ncbi:hypothetical protein RhiirA5_444888 [Rhizophagus irregularis]|uniref:Uncharacterized protein n=1 Tax=Rhizophagus irregularis TaxID=588596 RepID=A0A2N0NCU3_9GLOM|nr:hypothetical protein RhiirA5_444888 [Rhizophagus irregularis]
MAEISTYQRILKDLRQLQPTEIVAYPPPYTTAASLEEKFDLINAAIERAKRIDNRILMLANVYYLGHFLEVGIQDNTRRVSRVEQTMRTTQTTPP